MWAAARPLFSRHLYALCQTNVNSSCYRVVLQFCRFTALPEPRMNAFYLELEGEMSVPWQTG